MHVLTMESLHALERDRHILSVVDEGRHEPVRRAPKRGKYIFRRPGSERFHRVHDGREHQGKAIDQRTVQIKNDSAWRRRSCHSTGTISWREGLAAGCARVTESNTVGGSFRFKPA